MFQSVEDRDAMIKSGMEQGLNETMERLKELLAGRETPMTEGTKLDAIADREIIATRLFDAPRELVWEVWTDPKHLAQWWGPNGFTNTIHEIDVRPGGVWRFIMHGPDGTDYKNEIVYVEVVKPERLVYDHVSGPKFHVTVTFNKEGDRTRLAMQMLFESAAERENTVKKFGAIEGLNQTLGRLEQHLEKMAGHKS